MEGDVCRTKILVTYFLLPQAVVYIPLYLHGGKGLQWKLAWSSLVFSSFLVCECAMVHYVDLEPSCRKRPSKMAVSSFPMVYVSLSHSLHQIVLRALNPGSNSTVFGTSQASLPDLMYDCGQKHLSQFLDSNSIYWHNLCFCSFCPGSFFFFFLPLTPMREGFLSCFKFPPLRLPLQGESRFLKPSLHLHRLFCPTSFLRDGFSFYRFLGTINIVQVDFWKVFHVQSIL